MTSQTYENNSIMAYVGADADVVGYSGFTALPDWNGSKVYFFQTSDLSSPGIRQFDIDPDGDETLQRSKSALGLSAINTSLGAASISVGGDKLFFISETGNSAKLAKVNASDLTLDGQFGTASSSTSDSTSSRILSPHIMVNITDGVDELICAAASSKEEIDSLATSGFSTNVRVGTLTEQKNFGAILGYRCAVGLPFANGTSDGHNADKIGVYTITASVITRVGQFDYADIDVTWTGISTLRGCAYDENDGNMLVGVQALNVGPTNTAYIAKISLTTGAVLWKCAVNSLTAYSAGFAHCRITNDRFHYLGSSATVYHINTTNGTKTTETFTGLAATGPQYSDDVTNSLILFGSFSPGGSPPDYLGTYMDTGGHHTLSSKWMRVWFATAGGVSEGDGGNQGGLSLSEKRAWTYTLDGHVHYVLDLKTEGTWVYDTLTQQWSKFYTEDFNGRWDAINGVMWGSQRIVAGDINSTEVWEISPSALTDNDGDSQITHVVTGGLQTRKRNKLPVSALRIAGSVGDLGNTAGSTMSLRFSDDNGRTWVGPFTVTLTQADYSGEIAFRALGSFAAPGRIFELTDVGGPKRIDGADAEIAGLDDGNAAG